MTAGLMIRGTRCINGRSSRSSEDRERSLRISGGYSELRMERGAKEHRGTDHDKEIIVRSDSHQCIQFLILGGIYSPHFIPFPKADKHIIENEGRASMFSSRWFLLSQQRT